MSTYADQSRDKALDIERLCLRLKADINAAKLQCRDPAALDVLALLTAELLLISVDCAQLKSSISTAATCREFDRRGPDPRMERTREAHELAGWIERKREEGADYTAPQPELAI